MIFHKNNLNISYKFNPIVKKLYYNFRNIIIIVFIDIFSILQFLLNDLKTLMLDINYS